MVRSLGTIVAQIFTRKGIGPGRSIKLGNRILEIFKGFDRFVEVEGFRVRTTQPGYINQIGDNTEGTSLWFQSNVIIPYQIDSFA